MTFATAPVRRALRALALGSALTLGAACYHPGHGAPVDRTTVVVDNQSFYDFNVYVIPEGGAAMRLGFARAKSKTTFTLPANVVPATRTLQFEARPIATQGGPVSEQVVVSPGDEVGLQIPPL